MERAIIILTALTAIGALGAAAAAWWSAVVTKRVAQAQLFAILLRDYSSQEMNEALIRLHWVRQYKQRQPPEEFESWLSNWNRERVDLKSKAERVKDARRYDEARRRVSHYFVTALELYENKCIDKDLLKVICSSGGFGLLYEVVEGLEYAINSNYDDSQFDRLLKFYTGSEKKKQKLEKARPKKKGRAQ